MSMRSRAERVRHSRLAQWRGAVRVCDALSRCQTYSVEVSEHTNTRVLPEALVGVVTLEEYQARPRGAQRRSCCMRVRS
jgi:hypothetical protein